MEEYEDESSSDESLPEIRTCSPAEWNIDDDYDYDRITDDEGENGRNIDIVYVYWIPKYIYKNWWITQ